MDVAGLWTCALRTTLCNYSGTHCLKAKDLKSTFSNYSQLPTASLVAQMVKNLPAVQEIWVWSLGREDHLVKGMATHSSILAWRLPWTEEPGRLQSMGSKESERLRHDWSNLAHMHTSHFDLLCQLNCHCLKEAVFCFREYFYKVQETKILSPTFKLARSVFFKLSYRKSNFLVFRCMNC